MLIEAFQYLTTPCPRYVRKLGYLKEAIGISARYQRCKDHWLPHLEQTALYIQEASTRCKSRNCVMVLGAGSLYDIPLAWLTQEFKQVLLVDIVWLAPTKKIVARHSAEIIQADITDVAEALYQEPSILPTVPVWQIEREVDFIISANVLSQLPLLPRRYLQRHHPGKDQEIYLFCQQIIASHLTFLETVNAPACLITDTMFLTYNESHRLTKEQDALYGVTLPNIEKQWDWSVAPAPEINQKESRVHQVAACCI